MKNEKKTGWYTSEGSYIGNDSESIVAYLEEEGLLGNVVVPWCNNTYNSYDMLYEAWKWGDFNITDETMLQDFGNYVDSMQGHDLEFEDVDIFIWEGEE